MPRIRKKTSKRGTTHKRSKIQDKVKESRKKAKKEAKKNTQWKSKHKKDPGIPNNFPYKDQILAEIAAQRRQEEEAKQLRKEQKKALKNASNGEDAENAEDTTGFDGITSVGSVLKPSAPQERLAAKGKGKAATLEEDDDVPILMNSEYANLKSVLDKADIVLHVLDSRDPLAYQSSHLREYVKTSGRGKIFLVLNKIDTCPRESVQAWAENFRREFPTFFFRSASAFLPRHDDRNKTTEATESTSTSDAKGLKVLLQALHNEADKKGDEALIVAVVGVANTGKSALVNSFFRKAASAVYKLNSAPPGPSTTERALELFLEDDGKKIVLIDTPALFWESDQSTDDEAVQQRAKDILLRNKGRIDRAKDPITPITQIVPRANTEDLMIFYTLPAFSKGDTTAFLSALSRRHHLIKKHGELDLVGSARIVLRDWSTGKFPKYTHPSSPPESVTGNVDAELKALYAKDEEILSSAPLRKEMRKGAGLIKLVHGEAEKRKIALEAPWDEESEESEVDGDEDEDDGGDDDEIEGMSEDEGEEGEENIDEQDDEDDDESEEEVPPPKGKRKRQEKSAPAPSSKKVAFAPPPKGSKQARAQPPPKTPAKAPAKHAGKKQRK